MIAECVTPPAVAEEEKKDHQRRLTSSGSDALPTHPSSTTSVRQQSSEILMNLNESRVINCKSSKLNLNFEVNVLNEASLSQQKCFILTVHDIGYDSNQFEKLINDEKMEGIRNRVIWLQVTLPGQELEAPDLDVKKYPSLEELADGLLNLIDELKIPQVVCMGTGAGANIAFHFACQHSTRCLGLVLIDPVGSPAGFVESIRHILTAKRKPRSFSFNMLDNGGSLLQARDRARSIFTRLEETYNMDLINSSNVLPDSRNGHNLKLFTESFFNRSGLIEKISELKADTLIACGKNSSFYGESKRLFKALQDANKKTPRKMVNSPFLELDNIADVLKESPKRLATSFQYFLQGIGLVSAMPMRTSLRSMSICVSMPSTSTTCGGAPSSTGRSMSEDNSSCLNQAPAAASLEEETEEHESNSKSQSNQSSQNHSNQSLNE